MNNEERKAFIRNATKYLNEKWGRPMLEERKEQDE